jgi:hypothetical protein
MKVCIDCKQKKQAEQFPFDKSRNRYLSVCKQCTAIRTENYRQQNKDKWKEQSKNHSLKRKNIVDKWKTQGCIKCGDKRPYVIDAHHLDPTKKDFSVGTSIRGVNITKIELEKCIPLCSNCHREFHYQEKEKGITIKDYLAK